MHVLDSKLGLNICFRAASMPDLPSEVGLYTLTELQVRIFAAFLLLTLAKPDDALASHHRRDVPLLHEQRRHIRHKHNRKTLLRPAWAYYLATPLRYTDRLHCVFAHTCMQR